MPCFFLPLDKWYKMYFNKIRDSDKRKEEFIKDLYDFIDEFSQADESLDFIKYYDD